MSRPEDEGPAKRSPARPSLHDDDLDEFGPTLGVEPAKPSGGLRIAVNRPVPMAELITPEAEQRKKIAQQATFVAMRPGGLPPAAAAASHDAEKTDADSDPEPPRARPPPAPRPGTSSGVPRKPGKAPPRVPSRKR